MALAEQQDIPEKPKISEPWTFRRLFPFAGAVKSFTKIFANPFDVLLGYLVFILGIAELLGREVSWFFWVLTILILATTSFERHTGILSDTKLKEEPEEKK